MKAKRINGDKTDVICIKEEYRGLTLTRPTNMFEGSMYTLSFDTTKEYTSEMLWCIYEGHFKHAFDFHQEGMIEPLELITDTFKAASSSLPKNKGGRPRKNK